MKKIAILTSGGDAPGMNAAISSIVHSGFNLDIQVIGVLKGFEGLIDGHFLELNYDSIKNIIQRGGTILKTSRSKRFLLKSYRKVAFDHLKSKKIEGLIVIGGDGTFKGASVFSKEFQIPVVGIPCTIDNDLAGTDFCIGFDTAINTAMDAIDRIRDTAESHNRMFFVEVMGRDSGMIAMLSGIAGAAEVILMPETKMSIEELVIELKKQFKNNTTSLIVVVAEGDEEGDAHFISRKVKTHFPDLDIRITVLGHIQRGGKPTCMDRFLSIRLGVAALNALKNGYSSDMVGIVNNKVVYLSLERAFKKQMKLNQEMFQFFESFRLNRTI
ncbi:MAG: 6-phosphofructokinase [Crocinitomicaceae bacterium]